MWEEREKVSHSEFLLLLNPFAEFRIQSRESFTFVLLKNQNVGRKKVLCPWIVQITAVPAYDKFIYMLKLTYRYRLWIRR